MYQAAVPLLLAFLFNTPTIAGESGAPSIEALNSELVKAVNAGRTEAVRSLIRRGADANAKGRKNETVLLDAVEHHYEDIVRVLLGAGANVRKVSGDALCYAVGDMEIVKVLLDSGVDVNLPIDGGYSALMCAAYKGDLETTQALIDAEANVNARNMKGESAMALLPAGFRQSSGRERYDLFPKLEGLLIAHGATGFPSLTLLQAALAGDLKKARSLLTAHSKGRPGDAATSMALRAAIYKGHVDLLKEMIRLGMDVNAADDSGETAILDASNTESEVGVDIVNLLIEHGANVNAARIDGLTPLFCASLHCNIALIKVLIHAGAELKAKEGFMRRALIGLPQECAAPVAELLISAGADINAVDNNGVSALMEAIKWKPEIAEMLIAAGANVNSTDKDGNTALIEACVGGEPALVQLLLENKADVNHRDNSDKSALWFALSAGRKDVVEMLLLAGATGEQEILDAEELVSLVDKGEVESVMERIHTGGKVNVTDGKNRSPLGIAVAKNDYEMVKALLGAGAQPDYAPWETLLAKAAAGGDSRIVSALLEAGADVDFKNRFGTPPLMSAANAETARILIDVGADVEGGNALVYYVEKGDVDLVKVLIAAGADVNIRKEYPESTPLTIAAKAGNLDLARILLKAGVNPAMTDGDGMTALLIAAEEGYRDMVAILPKETEAEDVLKPALLLGAAKNGDLKKVQLLIQAGVNVDARNSKRATPLMIASWAGNLEVVQYLIQAGAAVNLVTKGGTYNALTGAAGKGYAQIVRALLDAGGYVDLGGLFNRTPLYFAVAFGHTEVVRLLIAAGANVNAKETADNWQTILHLSGNAEIVEMLKAAGAKDCD